MSYINPLPGAKKQNLITFNKRAAPVAPKQEKITNARVLLLLAPMA
jgi:hypothetical protein